MKIAFLTCAKKPSITEDDQVLADVLVREGCVVDGVPWDSERVNSRDYDLLLLRSTWDYHLRPVEFRRWLSYVADADLPLFNPPAVVRWNVNKKYLFALKEKGVGIPEGVFIHQRDREKANDIIRNLKAERVVVKPAVSATAFQTHLMLRDDLMNDSSRLSNLFDHGDVIVQEFLEEIETKGEISVMYFGGKFSHAVVKQAKSGDFRVQTDFGGTVRLFQPSDSILNEVASILSKIPECLYARVDGLDIGGSFVLMELELIEPVLFFRESPDAAVKMAAEILGS
jgi:glutathione synthase/RimK-type ligase-like ATP-grasp enzyme